MFSVYEKLKNKTNLICMLFPCNALMVITWLADQCQTGGRISSADSTPNHKINGMPGLESWVWTKKPHVGMPNILDCKFALNKRLIALTHFMKNGNSNGITANIMRMQRKAICKMIFVMRQQTVDKDSAVVLLRPTMKMDLNSENCTSAMMLTLMNGWTIKIGKPSIHSSAWMLVSNLVLHLLLLLPLFICQPDDK